MSNTKDVFVNVKMTSELKKALKQYAKKHDVSMGQVIRQAVRQTIGNAV